MKIPPRPLPFVLVATEQGTLLVNRLDYRMIDEKRGFGVGHEIFNNGSFDSQEINLAQRLLIMLRETRGDNIFALDCGANIGVHTISWSRLMTGWGQALAIEAQERIFYALAGNICINNLFNAKAINVAVGSEDGFINVPSLDYCRSASFGSLELIKRTSEYIGQEVKYDTDLQQIRLVAIDSLNLHRLDFVKMDIEGMEISALEGAKNTLIKFRPVMIIEKIKSDNAALIELMRSIKYHTVNFGLNILALPEEDLINSRIKISE